MVSTHSDITPYTFVNDSFVPSAQAVLPVTDLAFQRGYGIFDFFRALNYQPVFLDDHLDRFYRSAEGMFLEVPYSRVELKKIITELIEKNGIKNSGVKIILTGGNSPDGYSMGTPNLVLIQSALSSPDNESLQRGLHLATYDYQRQVPGIKTIDYLHAIYLKGFVKDKGADDLLYHHNGIVRESPRANIFIVKGNQIITPETDVLAGITRKKILSMPLSGYDVKEQDFSLDDLYNADEVFLSSSTRIAFAVTYIDGKPVSNGTPGAVTLTIRQKLNDMATATQSKS